MSNENLSDQDLLGISGVEADLELTLNELKAKYPDLKANKKAAAIKELGLDELAAEKERAKDKALKAEKERAKRLAEDKAAHEANVKRAQVEQREDEDYRPKLEEAHLYHVELEKPYHDSRSGKKLSPPAYIQMFTERDYADFCKHGKGHGYQQRVMWDPTKYE